MSQENRGANYRVWYCLCSHPSSKVGSLMRSGGTRRLANILYHESEVRTAFLRWVMRSFLSFSFFRPANAILVPGMYWAESMWGQYLSVCDKCRCPHLFRVLEVLEEGIFTPCDSLVHVGGSIRVSLGLSGLATKKPANTVSHNSVTAT